MDATLSPQITSQTVNYSVETLHALHKVFANLRANFENGFSHLHLLLVCFASNSIQNWEMAVVKISSTVIQKLNDFF